MWYCRIVFVADGEPTASGVLRVCAYGGGGRYGNQRAGLPVAAGGGGGGGGVHGWHLIRVGGVGQALGGGAVRANILH